MIRLKHITKIYSTKNKGGVTALKDVDLSFPDKGLCLILGKSGCGKTTLLNILGGLDVKFQGEYQFLDKKLSRKDFPDFRKNYVSFVFQDFNLIDDLDVSENLSIGYNFAAKDGDSQIIDALKKVGLEDYDYRFPQELSGGEQQRVAMARALLKDSKLLLADEPTGNLDRENGVEIYGLLKEISQNKLVIVVSHDEELGRQYADYVVRLDDGVVIESNLPSVSDCGGYVNKKIGAIRNKIALQMSWYEFTRKKSRSILTVLALVICLGVIAFGLPLWEYNSADSHYNLIKKYGYSHILTSDIGYGAYKDITDSGVDLSLSNTSDISGMKSNLVFQSKEEAVAHGIRLYECENELPLRADTYYISDVFLTGLIENGGNKAVINGEEVELNLTDYSLTDVVGGKLEEFGYSRTCAGVYYAPDTSNQEDDRVRYRDAYFGDYITTELFGLRREFLFIKVNYGNRSEHLSPNTRFHGVLTNDRRYNGFAGGEYVLLDQFGNVTELDDNSYNHLMSDKEVYMSLGCFNGAFNEHYSGLSLLSAQEISTEYGIKTVYSCSQIPPELGRKISIEITDRDKGEKNSVTDLTVKGILIDLRELKSTSGEYRIWFGGQQDLLECSMMANSFCAWADVSTVKHLRSDMRGYVTDYGCNYYSPARRTVNEFEKLQLHDMRDTTIFISSALSAVVLLAVALLIAGQILSRKREIGIFKALGAKGKDISKIYMFETLFMALITAVLSIVLAVCGTLLFDYMISPDYTVISYFWLNAPVTVLIVTALFLLGTALPLTGINKLNVIDSIRSKAGK